jgi:predicted Rossmann fold flavoprotein
MINWLPKQDEDSLKDLFTSYKQNFGNKKVLNQMALDIPKKLKIFLLEKAGISSDVKWADVNKKQLNKLVQLLTADIYPSKGKTTFKQEFVSCGGIKLNEVNFKTMESKLVPNLYFAGEVLNIDALTGGFNFQNAWTTSWIAAQDISGQ